MRPDTGPLLAGLARPRIVLPADFAQRYEPAEQAAVLAHERVHARRGDLWWNALAALLGCLFWFHPLAGPARRRYLADQELACDSAVLRTGLHAPRTYGNALLKTITTASLPVGCTMQAISPIKERIMHLQHPHHSTGSRRVRLAVAAALAGYTLAGAGLGWAATFEPAAAAGGTPAAASAESAAAAGGYRLGMDVSVVGGAVGQRLSPDGPAQWRRPGLRGRPRAEGRRERQRDGAGPAGLRRQAGSGAAPDGQAGRGDDDRDRAQRKAGGRQLGHGQRLPPQHEDRQGLSLVSFPRCSISVR
jgi:hypothetical protein